MTRIFVLLAALAVYFPAISQAATYTQSAISFETNAQSSEGTGAALEREGTKFVGTTWDTNQDFGPGIGSVPAPNPELASYALDYAAWEAVEAAKDVKYAAELTAYGTKYTAYLAAYGVCKVNPFCDNYPTKPTKPTRDAASPEPVAPPLTIDVKGGAEGNISTAGKVGFDLNYKLTAGSMDASLVFDVEAILPEGEEIKAGEAFNIITSSTFSSGEIVLDSPTAEASIDAVLQADVKVSGQACAAICTDEIKDFRLINIDEDVELVKVSPNEVVYLDGVTPDGVKLSTPLLDETFTLQAGIIGTPPAPVVVLDGPFIPKPPGVFADLAAVDLQVPVYSETGGKVGDSLHVTGRSDYIDLSLDLDALFSATGLPTLGGLSTGVGPIGVSFDAYDIDGIASLDLFQDLKLTPTLWVDFDFSKPVEIGGNLVETFSSVWDSLPSFKIFEQTTFVPNFFVKAVASTTLGLQAGLELSIDFLKGALSLSAFNKTLFSAELGPLYSKTFPFDPDFGRFSLFSNDSFEVAGFNMFAGEAFTLTPFVGTGNGDGQTPSVPLPPGIMMLLSGILGFAGLRGRKHGPYIRLRPGRDRSLRRGLVSQAA